jgi:anti-anti-sigma factor
LLVKGFQTSEGDKLDLKSEVADGIAIHRVSGKIDALTAPNLEAAVGSAISAGTARIVFDMRNVTYVSSAGLRAILSGTKRAAAADGRLVIYGLQSLVSEVFESSGLGNLILIAADENQARTRVRA